MRTGGTSDQAEVVVSINREQQLSLDDLTPILFGAAAFQYLNGGCELGLFDLLHDEPGLTKAQIAAALKLQPRAIDILLLGTTALRLTENTGGVYRNSSVVTQLQIDNAWQIFKDVVAFEQYIVYAGQVDFTESLRENRNVGLRQVPGKGRDLYHRLSENPHMQSAFYRYMHSWSALSNPLLFRHVDFGTARKVLDMGGGDGVNAVALAKEFPHLEISILEIPGGADIARANITRAGLSERIEVYEYDMFQGDYPEGHDCVLFAHQLVIWTPEENTQLLRNAYRALTPGGRVVIFSSISNDAGNGPLMAALDSVYFAASPAEGGMIYAWHQYEQWLREAGFRNIGRQACGTWTPHGVIWATKER
jgi:ubiquinone/menaquinone biosynthesis C-methylase UbiE